jgi:hypothetical protein
VSNLLLVFRFELLYVSPLIASSLSNPNTGNLRIFIPKVRQNPKRQLTSNGHRAKCPLRSTLEVGYLASRLGSLLLISRHANVAEVRILLSLCVQSNDRAILELTLHKSANLAIQQL